MAVTVQFGSYSVKARVTCKAGNYDVAVAEDLYATLYARLQAAPALMKAPNPLRIRIALLLILPCQRGVTAQEA